jgi:hypothetical protein
MSFQYGIVRGVAVSLLALILFTAGCLRNRERPVATVDGEHEISTGDLLYYYEKAREEESWPEGQSPEDRLRGVLEAATLGKTLELEAEARGYADDPAFQEELRHLRSQTLRDYMRRRIEDAVLVTEAEVLDFYEKSRKRRMYSFIELGDADRAEEAYRALQAGRAWEEVVATYSQFEDYAGPGGEWDAPMEYTGDAASEALFALKEPGSYTPPMVGAEGWEWTIYRLDKIVHGSGQTYAEAAPDLRIALKQMKAWDRLQKLAAAWRKATPITRDEELWEGIMTKPWAELTEQYYGRGLVLSEVGGVAVPYDIVWDIVARFFALPPAELDQLRADKPDFYRRVWDKYLADYENLALLEYRALREGIDQTPAFRREMANRRADALMERLYRGEFLATVPPPSEEELQAFYEAHQEELFYDPELVEVYLVAMPDRGELDRFYEEVRAGGDVVRLGEARSRAREQAEQELYELPPPLPPREQEWLGVVSVVTDPTFLNEPEAPVAAELRPRVFPVTELNVLSEIFRLRDGRWAFYEPIYHLPTRRPGLDNPEVAYMCQKRVREERLSSPEVTAAAEGWIRTLQAKHEVVVDEEALAAAAAEVRRREAARE